MKKFMVFGGGDDYYPRGGMEDWVADTDTLEEAKAECVMQRYGKAKYDWAHIYSIEEDKIVANFVDGKELGGEA